ncbi:FAD-dependent tricarballylate dehydrogenase TcuA [Pseudochelatococcus lubricantis]|uniref:FAD-dependent tricarballylate dehydrogenase TcuA n=1 Tax=Pseudochelatococcus lubricantis TaxID=1538102 RepID=UPI0035EC895C
MNDYDVIVIGAGNAALAAAVSAWEAGAKRTVVLEKAPRAMRGGNTHWAGGSLRIAFDKPSDLEPLVPGAGQDFFDGVTPYTREKFRDDLMRTTNGRTDPELSKVLINTSLEIVTWMRQTAEIEFEPAFNSKVVVNGKPVWGYGIAIRTKHEGAGLSHGWFEAVEKRGIEVRYGTAALDLVVDAKGRVSGVRVRNEDGVEILSARAVILGCGGFEANVQMRTQHMGPEMGGAKVRGTPHNQGDGIRMALDVGAMPWGQYSGCHATPISADWGEFAPRELTDRSNRLSYTYGLMLNRRGRRFVDEGENLKGYTYAKYGRAVLGQPGALAWQIFDSKVVEYLEPRYSTSKPITANTIEELIEKLDIDDRKQAVETIRAYNEVAHGPEGFDPQRLDGLATEGLNPEKTNWALKLDTPPYYAYSATGGITFTFGGIKINTESEVIGTDWRPLPGLYACGEMVGGLFYDNYPAGSGLIAGAIFGRIAGRNAAADARRLGYAEAGKKVAVAANNEEWVP